MTEQQLNDYSIFTLRELARRVGVKSPTSKKKEQLIKEILEIESGARTPNEVSKQGRPPKNFGYSFIDVMNPENSVFAGKTLTNISFKQEAPKFDYNDSKDICGYVEQVNEHTNFLWVKNNLEYNCYFIPANLVAKHSLKTGDLVNVEIGSAEEKMLVKEILAINSCPVNKAQAKRSDYYKIEHILPSRKMEFKDFENLNINYGESVYFYGDNNTLNSINTIDLLNNASAKKIYLNLSVAEKNKHIVGKLKNAEMFVSDVFEGSEKSKKLIAIAFERAKRLFELGLDVVVLIDDVQTIWSIDDGEHQLVKKLMSLTKEAGKKGSISIWALMSENDQLKLFEKLADKRFKISENKIISC